MLIVAGLWSLTKRQRGVAIMLCVPVLTALLASCLQMYPLDGRLTLFLAPGIPIALAAGLETLFPRLTVWQRGAVCLVLLAPTLFWATESCIRGQARAEIRPILRHVGENCQSGDVIYFTWHASFLYRHYRELLGDLPPTVEVYEEGVAGRSLVSLTRRLEGASPVKRVWAIHAMTVEWRARDPGPGIDHDVSLALSRWGAYVNSVVDRGAAVELYRRRDDALPNAEDSASRLAGDEGLPAAATQSAAPE